MREKEAFHQRRKADDDHGKDDGGDHGTEMTPPPIQQQWPLLGKEVVTLEDISIVSGAGAESFTEHEKQAQREKIRSDFLAQLYRNDGSHTRDIHHLAFLLLRQGRGGAIVGNPFARGQDGTQQELPYTGLEGYYAGSERTSIRPGMTREEILLEEANIGAHVLKNMKKDAIEQNTWQHITRVKNVLDQKKDDLEALRWIEIAWSGVVRRLHVRVYQNPEFEPTLTERMEQVNHFLNERSARTDAEKQAKTDMQAEYERLKYEYQCMSAEERKQEKQERKIKEWIRADRLEEFRCFQNETYQILGRTSEGQYFIGIQDASPREATITETITLPRTLDRALYPLTVVHFTPEQLEGYLSLVKLGERGGDPLTRSTLVSP
ncbi:MAG TPA: hypothetical protein VL485_02165 [Ktedonobacteraceae bacterium]|nr:hypothetical protein [Ktedonobacteraceae bacterium]